MCENPKGDGNIAVRHGYVSRPKFEEGDQVSPLYGMHIGKPGDVYRISARWPGCTHQYIHIRFADGEEGRYAPYELEMRVDGPTE